jgi:hypothetical protein
MGTAKTLEHKEKLKDAAEKNVRAKKSTAPATTKSAPAVSIETQLNQFLIDYDVRLIEIDYRYPLGHKDRADWLVAHRKNGVKRLMEIMGGKG